MRTGVLIVSSLHHWGRRNSCLRVMKMAAHIILNTRKMRLNSSLFIIYTHSQGRENTSCNAGPHVGCTWKWSEQPVVVGSRLHSSNKRIKEPSGICWRMWLACFNNFVGLQGTKTCYLGLSRNCAWSLWSGRLFG